MIEVKEEYPLNDFNGLNPKFIKHWAEDENGVKYIIKQVETDSEFVEAVDLYPCKFTYVATDKKVDDEGENNGLQE